MCILYINQSKVCCVNTKEGNLSQPLTLPVFVYIMQIFLVHRSETEGNVIFSTFSAEKNEF